MSSISPIGQFRSNVQWYLEGNTPNFSSELAASLLVALKLLATDLESIENNPQHELAIWLKTLSTRSLQDNSQLCDIVERLNLLNAAIPEYSSKSRPFRDAIVQLILLAEHSNDLRFRKLLLDLAKSIG